jgi:hypothetical protein
VAARTLPTMPDWTTGQEITSALLNQITTYNRFWANRPMFRMYQSAAQSIPTASATQIACDTPVWDTDSGRSAVNPYNYVVPFTGRWVVRGAAIFNANATGARVAFIYQNGVQIPAASVPFGNAGTINGGAFVEVTIACNIGDTLGLYGYQSSGGALNTAGAGQLSYFEGQLESLGSP